MKKRNALLIILGFIFLHSNLGLSQTESEINNKRSDTINVLNYQLKLDFTQLSSQILAASCKVVFKSKQDNIEGISLDLLQLTVDSITTNGTAMQYSYNDTLLRITFPNNLNTGDKDSVTVFYHGTPQTDASGFGGFYFSGDYSYSIGVGFDAKPHNYGRVWYPCFDNFVERATYTIQIKSPQGYTGYSNGYISHDSIGNNNENIRTWKMDDAIPSYLACVGVAPYTHVSETYTSALTGAHIPVMLIAEPQDTTNLKNSFVHLFNAMDAFEADYGKYRWNKIGYCVVPFSGGAMEHATCIMYPKMTVNGSLQYEASLMAHELSHHWWGDLVTCKTAEDMWINEGMASYSEDLFLEHLYGKSRYMQDLQDKHLTTLQHAAYDDGGFYPLSGVPHDATYGTTTYQKGATMMHNLRTYMGDTDFFAGLKSILNTYAFQPIDAAEFRDQLTSSTNFDATEFFTDYVFNPGTNGFEIDSSVVQPSNGEFQTKVYIQQKLFHAPAMYNDVPLQITFMDGNWNEYTVTKIVSGEHDIVTVNVPFDPTFIYLNKDSHLLNAVTGIDSVVRHTGILNLPYAYFHMNVTSEDDSSFLRVEHYRIAPDPIADAPEKFEYAISPDRYWKVGGIWSNSFKAKARIEYIAKNVANGNLDNGLMQSHNGVAFTEDSLVLLWRPNEHKSWKEFSESDYVIYPGDETDGSGLVQILDLKKGEYALGFRKSSAGLSEQKLNPFLSIFPNPTKDQLNVVWKGNTSSKEIKIFDINGRIVKTSALKGGMAHLSMKMLRSGIYFLKVYEKDKEIAAKKLVKE